MNGNFEENKTVYPIGYLLNGDCSLDGPTYDIVDMRTLTIVQRTKLTAKQLEPIVHTLNENLRAGKYADGLALADDALLLLLADSTPKDTATAGVVAPPEAPDENRVSERTAQIRAPQGIAFIAPLEPLEKL